MNSTVGGIAKDQLKSYIDRIERMEDEATNIRNDVKEIYMEAKANGFDTKIMKKILVLKRMDAADREETEQLLNLYMEALDI